MNYRRNGLRLLGLLAVAALGVLALAASAQAIVLPGFLINGKPFSLLATVGAEQEGRGTLLVPSLNFEVNCERFTVDEGAIESKDDAVAKLLYNECTTLSITKLPEEINCEVAEPITAEALILPAEMKKDKVTGEELPVAVLAEKVKALIRLWLPGTTPPLSKECVLPNDNTVTGELCLKIDNNDTVTPLLLASQAIQEECKERKVLEALGEEVAEKGFKDLLKYGAQDVFVDGKAKLFLTGAHNGLTLGVSLYAF